MKDERGEGKKKSPQSEERKGKRGEFKKRKEKGRKQNEKKKNIQNITPKKNIFLIIS